jgi:hypothetical protein
MAYGFEIYNASGNITLKRTSRVPRIVQTGTVSIDASGYSISGSFPHTFSSNVTVSGCADDGTWDVITYSDEHPNGYRTNHATINTGSIDMNMTALSYIYTFNITDYKIYYYILRT